MAQWMTLYRQIRLRLYRILWMDRPAVLELAYVHLYFSLAIGLFLLGVDQGPIYKALTDMLSTPWVGLVFLSMGVLHGVTVLLGPYWLRRVYMMFTGSLWLGFAFYYAATPLHRIGTSTCLVLAFWSGWAYLRLGCLQRRTEARLHGRTLHTLRSQTVDNDRRKSAVSGAPQSNGILPQAARGPDAVSYADPGDVQNGSRTPHFRACKYASACDRERARDRGVMDETQASAGRAATGAL